MYIWNEQWSKHTSRYYCDYNQINNNKDMIISFIYYVTLSKFVDSSFPQYNVHTCVQGGCLAFTPMDGYLKLRIEAVDIDFMITFHKIVPLNFE